MVTAVSPHLQPSNVGGSRTDISLAVIQALINRSGPLGLEAFLPPLHRIHYSGAKRLVKDVDPLSIPRLPLVKRPEDASFTLPDVLREWGTVRVRDWVLRAMERYRFVIGNTPGHFGMLDTPKKAEFFFKRINADKKLALLTINDDVVMQEDLVDSIFRSFLEEKWSFPGAWEEAL